MLEDALLEVAQEDKYGKTEIANAGEILRVLRGEVDAEAFEEWIRRAVIFLQSKKVLLSWLHGEDEDGELQTEERENRKGTSKENYAVIALRGLWEEWQNASTPHRRKPSEQLAGELDKTLLELSRETASVEKFMCCVRIAAKGEGFMPEALPADEGKENHSAVFCDLYNHAITGEISPCLNASSCNSPTHSGPTICISNKRGDTAESGKSGEGTADNAEGSPGGGVDAISECRGAFETYHENIKTCATLKQSDHKGPQVVCFKEREGKPGGGKGILCGDKPFTLSTLTDQAVCYAIDSYASNSMKSKNPHSGYHEENISRCIDTSGSNPVAHQGGNVILEAYSEVEPVVYAGGCVTSKANGQNPQPGDPCPTLHNDSRNYLVRPAKPPRRYIIRRLTPLECCRLQGFPDDWCSGLGTENPTEEDISFWSDVWETHRKIMGKSSKPKTRKQIIKWLNNPHSDSAEYKMWGNGVALPNAAHVVGCAVKLIKETQT